MPFEILRNDITKMKADAIVNTANPRPVIGSGVDSMLHQAAGPELLKARQAIGPIAVGEAEVTDAFALQARFVIHTVGPVW
jgi:O-acetyl-ADP-ribose deacetylase (regulator of RNase III)